MRIVSEGRQKFSPIVTGQDPGVTFTLARNNDKQINFSKYNHTLALPWHKYIVMAICACTCVRPPDPAPANMLNNYCICHKVKESRSKAKFEINKLTFDLGQGEFDFRHVNVISMLV